MRFFSFLVLVALLGAVGLFAYQNNGDATVRFWDWVVTAPLSAVVGVVYLLGMITGWSVLGLFRRSLERVTDYHTTREHARVFAEPEFVNLFLHVRKPD